MQKCTCGAFDHGELAALLDQCMRPASLQLTNAAFCRPKKLVLALTKRVLVWLFCAMWEFQLVPL
jgi:hypothetical protein